MHLCIQGGRVWWGLGRGQSKRKTKIYHSSAEPNSRKGRRARTAGCSGSHTNNRPPMGSTWTDLVRHILPDTEKDNVLTSHYLSLCMKYHENNHAHVLIYQVCALKCTLGDHCWDLTYFLYMSFFSGIASQLPYLPTATTATAYQVGLQQQW